MRILIQKFGGTSVANESARKAALTKITAAKEAGYAPVVVVSAMGRIGDPYATDTLIQLVRQYNVNPQPRELDQIMYCGEIISAAVMASMLQASGLAASALTGGQAGILTDDRHTNARILKVQTNTLQALLAQGIIPVVCGFQGITTSGELTTLGRGGSDTTAAALGTALNAEKIEIYTDVDGIMTADPRLVKEAKILTSATYQEVCQMAEQGAKVIHPRAVEIAMQKNIPMVIRSTFSDEPGTLITNQITDLEKKIEDKVVTSVAYVPRVAQVRVRVTDKRVTAAAIFRKLGAAGISVDFVTVSSDGIVFTVAEGNADKSMHLLSELPCEVLVEKGCTKVSIVGGGMREVPGVMADFMEALLSQQIGVLQTIDSHTSISALVKESDLANAVTVLHKKFQLSL